MRMPSIYMCIYMYIYIYIYIYIYVAIYIYMQARRKQFKGGQAKAKQYLQQLYMWCCGVDTACGPMP